MDFAAALDVNVNDIERPLDLPQGTYIWAVSKVPETTTSKSGEWTIVEFPLKAISAEDDVDSEALAEFGALTSVRNRINFMLPNDPDKKNDVAATLFRIKKFLTEVLRVDTEGNPTLKEMMANCVNHQFLGQAVWRIDGDQTYVDVKNYSALD